MQVPKRKPGKYTFDRPDLNLTEEKYAEIKAELLNLKKIQPKLATEVKRLAEMGDLSENAGYQIAKGQLRGVNQKITELEDQVHRAVIINPNRSSGTISLGNTIIIENQGRQQTFQILGSQETDPAKGIISHNSPIGAALIGHGVGETVKIKLKDKEIEFKIIKIE